MRRRTHCEETRMTSAVASSAANPRDGVKHAIWVPIARVLLFEFLLMLCCCVRDLFWLVSSSLFGGGLDVEALFLDGGVGWGGE